jgi:mono/diheme cytochrome c family protein
MKRSTFLSLTGVAGLTVSLCVSGMVQVTAKPISYKLPEETAKFKPGPNLEVVQNNCTACHSADYVATQPRGPKYKEDFWKAEVNKMINAYGAPIDQADVGKIVEYLAKTY